MTHRDEVRAARNTINNKGKQLGIDMEAERSKAGANERTITYETQKLINTQIPRRTREQLQVDDPPNGAFNGVNTSFALSAPALGENIVVIWHDSANITQWVLEKSNANPPGNHAFFFDQDTPDQIVVGNAPAAADNLVAVYKVER